MEPAYIPALLPDGWRDVPFEPFRDGIEVHYLWRADSGPVCALLRYAPGASVPRHWHPGLETIIVLEGVQSDERGAYGPGTVIMNPQGSVHSVWTDQGCVVLIQWEKPVEFLTG